MNVKVPGQEVDNLYWFLGPNSRTDVVRSYVYSVRAATENSIDESMFWMVQDISRASGHRRCASASP